MFTAEREIRRKNRSCFATVGDFFFTMIIVQTTTCQTQEEEGVKKKKTRGAGLGTAEDSN